MNDLTKIYNVPLSQSSSTNLKPTGSETAEMLPKNSTLEILSWFKFVTNTKV